MVVVGTPTPKLDFRQIYLLLLLLLFISEFPILFGLISSVGRCVSLSRETLQMLIFLYVLLNCFSVSVRFVCNACVFNFYYVFWICWHLTVLHTAEVAAAQTHMSSRTRVHEHFSRWRISLSFFSRLLHLPSLHFRLSRREFVLLLLLQVATTFHIQIHQQQSILFVSILSHIVLHINSSKKAATATPTTATAAVKSHCDAKFSGVPIAPYRVNWQLAAQTV